ncbi:Arylsulfatase [Pontiella desulfatans]|uniref:Arylsulfatase n=2 Tax=Pontiella desulfatans TaxID=2750659 RepID=A0A6C2U9J5_PONDE|nr:sulfatase S1_15 [Kiritimatiellales bacterium]VGO16397.1 Arylsulfatase [Pontiella desulfatans]
MGIGLAGMLAVLAQAADQPNVVIIYGDDVGYGDVGAYGSEKIPTPNIDRLAAQGLRFTDGHCSAATCTPSRFSMLTGIHGFRHNARVLPPNAPLIVPTDKLTLPKLFKKAGYQTAVIGKWHLGIGEKGTPVDWNGDVKPGPLEVGFDYSFLLPSTNDRVPCVLMRNHRVIGLDPKDPLYVGNKLKEVQKPGSTQYPDGRTNREAMTFYPSTHGHDNSVINGIGRIGYQSGGKSALWDDATLSDVFVEEMKSYIADHKEKPFFLYFASQDIHVPRVPHPRFRGATKLGYRGDAMVQFDWTVGEIMKTLEQHGLTENTIVVFSSDNGPVYDDGYEDGTTVLCSEEEGEKGHDGSGIWRGGKYQIYEGGTRVPFIVSWPAKIQPGTSDALVNQIDLLASFADLLDQPLAKDDAADSRGTLDAFLGKDEVGQEYMIEESFGLALRNGDWKYIEPSQPQWPNGRPAIERSLYHLEKDPSETTNVIAEYPEVADEMEQQLKKMVESGGIRSLK